MTFSNYDDYAWEDRGRERDYSDPYEYSSPPHSGMGIASCIIGGLVFVFAIIIFIVAVVMEESNPEFFENDFPNTPEEIAIVLMYLLDIVIALVGIVLGIIGAATPRRNKLFAGIGIGLNSLIFLGLIFVMILGAIFG
jgi:hypothetical protein